mmetsp:Transcript_29972/g.86021  ORF Transcript_29972/g.86021 Transcript_29972/m.86021 type:complete len:405 (+) Transcript_29972:82-1296(+)
MFWNRVVLLCLCLRAVVSLDILGSFGTSIGNGAANFPICAPSVSSTLIFKHTLQAHQSHGVLYYFWATGTMQKIDRMWVDYYVDGEEKPSISFQPAMMCGQAYPDLMAKNDEFSAGGLCGKSAPVGGWWNTFPIPFYKKIIVKVRADKGDRGCFSGYVSVRGSIGGDLVLPGSNRPLPHGARLRLQRRSMRAHVPLAKVVVARLPLGEQGLLLQTSWAVQAKPEGGARVGGGYIEGCWHLLRTAQEEFPGLVVGTGLEDYFNSAYYFGADSGDPVGTMFSTPLSGLTLFNRSSDGYERISAYRFHVYDPLVMKDGGALVWSVGEQLGVGNTKMTKCGNRKPKPPDYSLHVKTKATPTGKTMLLSRNSRPHRRKVSPVNVTTYAWIYVMQREENAAVALFPKNFL